MIYLYKLSKLSVFVFISFISLFVCSCIQQTDNSYDPFKNQIDDYKFSQKQDTEFSKIITFEEEDNSRKKKKNSPFQIIFDKALELCQSAQNSWEKGNIEQALESLDKAYYLIIGVNVEKTPEAIQQKEDIRFLISKRIMEIYASRMTAANGIGNEIPIIINKYVQKEIELFTTGSMKTFFIRSYKRSGIYRPKIVKMLKKANLPEELSWLPLIESGFNVKALSKARALGLWQFIPSTGYKFGLKRDTYIDERIDFIKSTEAAIAYLKELHQIFGDWTTALAGYNCGEGKVLRIISKQNINYLDDFWDLYEKLPNETAKYVPRFLATLHIVKNPEKYGLNKVITDKQIPYEVVNINKQTSLKNIAKVISEPESLLKNLNPELKYGVLPPEKYSVRTPEGKGKLLIANIDNLPITVLKEKRLNRYINHKVKKGETISTIARQYKTSIKSIAKANKIKKYNMIFINDYLKIPIQGGVIYQPSVASAKGSGKLFSYKVQRGDSLWNLARRYGTTTKNIKDINNLSTTRLYIGQILRIIPNKS